MVTYLFHKSLTTSGANNQHAFEIAGIGAQKRQSRPLAAPQLQKDAYPVTNNAGSFSCLVFFVKETPCTAK